MTYCFNDQTKKFDRIRPNLNGVGSQRLGLPKEATISHAMTLTGIHHRIQTSHGASTETIPTTPGLGGVG